MVQTRGVGACLYLFVFGVTSAYADSHVHAPKTLQMRSRPASATPLLHTRIARPVAQAPAPNPPPDGSAPTSGPPSPGGESGATPNAEGTSPARPDENAPTEQALIKDASAELSEAEFAKLAEQSSHEEVIIVTGSTIGRKSLTTPAPLTILDRELLYATGQGTLGDSIQPE